MINDKNSATVFIPPVLRGNGSMVVVFLAHEHRFCVEVVSLIFFCSYEPWAGSDRKRRRGETHEEKMPTVFIANIPRCLRSPALTRSIFFAHENSPSGWTAGVAFFLL